LRIVGICIIIYHMKTIAITIDERSLVTIDQALEERAVPGKNRSQVIRLAVQEYLTNLQRKAELEKERKIFRRNRRLLKQQALALIKEQARL
jgi:hypothetical protein